MYGIISLQHKDIYELDNLFSSSAALAGKSAERLRSVLHIFSLSSNNQRYEEQNS